MRKGGEVFSGKVAALGTRADVEARMSELEDNSRDRSPVETNGELNYMYLECNMVRTRQMLDMHVHAHFVLYLLCKAKDSR